MEEEIVFLLLFSKMMLLFSFCFPLRLCFIPLIYSNATQWMKEQESNMWDLETK